MKIVVDGFGGDKSPLEVIKGCIMANNEYNVDIIITGDEQKIKDISRDNNLDISKLIICHCNDVILVEDNPFDIINSKKQTSLGMAFKLLNDGDADGFVSGGSTGAVVVGSSFIIKRIKGIKRPALSPIIPNDKGCYILLDAGANLECKPEMLLQFAVMGSLYMKNVMNVSNPSVGLVNVGAEEVKGTSRELDAFALLKSSNLNFIGNVEPRYIPSGACDVVVCDGFTGNVILKLSEGLGRSFANHLKSLFYDGGLTSKLSAFMIKKSLSSLKNKMDYTEYGGAVLLGVRKPIIKAHGSSNAYAFKNAIRQACAIVNNKVIDNIDNFISGN